MQIEKINPSNKKIIITCSYDFSFSKYFTGERISREEDLVTNLLSLTSEVFNKFKNLHGVFPRRAFIYRSGVSDEEKKSVFIREILGLETYFNSLNNNFEYVFIVVNKKTDMKFFVIDENGRDLSNPQDGTLIDDVITTQGQYEFYLQNQFVNQGCATPTHYHVLRCTMPIPQHALQEITYHMSYYYWNWSGPIRLPACLKFAETYSKFIGSSITNKEVMDKLKNKPYYI